MRVATVLSALLASGIPFAYALDVKFYLDGDNCRLLGGQCGDLPPNSYCSAGGVAYATLAFVGGSSNIDGYAYRTSNDGNPCAIGSNEGLQKNVCYIEAAAPVTCAQYFLLDSNTSQDREAPKFVEVDSIFFQDGTTTYHINTTNADKVDTFWTIFKASGRAAGLDYMVQHFDRIEQSNALTQIEKLNSA